MSLRASPSDTSNISEKTEVLYGAEKTIEIMVQLLIGPWLDMMFAGTGQHLFILGSDPLRNALVGLKKEVLD